MEKKINKMQLSALRNVAKSVYPFKAKLAKLNEQIEAIEAEKTMIEKTIASFEEGSRNITGGYTSDELLERVEVKTGKFDTKTGKEIITVRYDLKYPETGYPTRDITEVSEKPECVDYTPECAKSLGEKNGEESALPDDFFA